MIPTAEAGGVDRRSLAERIFRILDSFAATGRSLTLVELALLAVAAHNLGAWHELRIAHARVGEPEHLAWTLEDARMAIAAETSDDLEIADALRVVADRLTTPQPHDGLAPWQRRELTEARSKLDELAAWFAHQRVLDLAPLGEVPYPTVKESFRHVARGVGDLAGRSFDAMRERLARGRDSDMPELPAAEPPADPPAS